MIGCIGCSSPQAFARCCGCDAPYCSRGCFVAHWGAHKEACYAAMRAQPYGAATTAALGGVQPLLSLSEDLSLSLLLASHPLPPRGLEGAAPAAPFAHGAVLFSARLHAHALAYCEAPPLLRTAMARNLYVASDEAWEQRFCDVCGDYTTVPTRMQSIVRCSGHASCKQCAFDACDGCLLRALAEDAAPPPPRPSAVGFCEPDFAFHRCHSAACPLLPADGGALAAPPRLDTPLACSGCAAPGCAVYCSVACQAASWPHHKRYCKGKLRAPPHGMRLAQRLTGVATLIARGLAPPEAEWPGAIQGEDRHRRGLSAPFCVLTASLPLSAPAAEAPQCALRPWRSEADRAALCFGGSPRRVFLILPHPFLRASTLEAPRPHPFTWAQRNATVMELLAAPLFASAAGLVTAALLALQWMYAEEGRACPPRFFDAAAPPALGDRVPPASALGLGMGLDAHGAIASLGPHSQRLPRHLRWASEGPFALGEEELAALELYGLRVHRPAAWPEGWVAVVAGMY